MEAVVDPNVWVSALINPYGVPAKVVEAVLSGQVVAVVSQQLLDELTAVLIRPKFRRWLSIADAVSFVETLGAIAEFKSDPESSPRRVRDPDDDYLAALAKAAGVPIVTGDSDLLEADLAPAAITPRQLVEGLRRRD